jgi:ribose 5-phosphate isomerase A
MGRDQQKLRAAEAALELVRSGEILGVGSGSTVRTFIELVGERLPGHVAAAVPSSEETSALLREIGIEVLDLNEVQEYRLYVDGADEFEPGLSLIKGGGAALTGEKIVASAARTFACIVDASKQVRVLGAYPLPVEVLPMGREQVARRLRALGGRPVLRDDVTTDHGHQILDVHGLHITDPRGLEVEIDSMAGVVCCGIFARRRADLVLMGTDHGVVRFD